MPNVPPTSNPLLAVSRRLFRAAPFPVQKGMVLTFHLKAAARRPLASLRYLLFEPRQLDNFTYEIANAGELAPFLASALRRPEAEVAGYLKEAASDGRELPYGRRLGWYAAARLLKPALVVESGVADGLGSALLLAALERNRAEGRPGVLIGIDLDPAAGRLVSDRLRGGFRLLTEDSVQALRGLDAGRPVDLFIHDTRYELEAEELRAVAPRLSPGAVIISDNAYLTRALEDYSAAHGRRFLFWKERSRGHFFPGAGIGISVPAVG